MVAVTELRTIGIVSPGAMGSALGRCFAAGGARVVATTAGRSPRTSDLAKDLELLPELADVVAEADLLLSVVPPDQAVANARTLAGLARQLSKRPLLADLNAIAPSTVQQIRAELEDSGCELLDGSISGGPPGPQRSQDTIVYLSGPAAAAVGGLNIPHVDLRVVGQELGTASAVKMCTASVYKGLSALLLQALQTAEFHGVTDLVLADLERDLPEHVGQIAAVIAMAASKADRYVGEMRQIALTQGAAGAQPSLFEGIAEVYEAVQPSRLAASTPEQASAASNLTEVLAALVIRLS
jgi:3-hydroxyisobutyrate dehydrogenase-like beta-hydroxyacid dehydrogenase